MIRERRGIIQNLINALATKPFVLLAGISGSGKTQLARRLAAGLAAGIMEDGRYTGHLLGGEVSGPAFRRMLIENRIVPELEGTDGNAYIDVHELSLPPFDLNSEMAARRNLRRVLHDRVAFLPVRPDWSDSSKIWGYYNPLTGLYYPTDALKVALHAYIEYVKYGDKAPRHFIILDELNLARVEYYLSDILSLMESPCQQEGNLLRMGEMARVHHFHRPLWTQSAPQSQIGLETSSHEQLFIGEMDRGWAKAYNYLCLGSPGMLVPRVPLDPNEIISGADWDRLVPPRIAFTPNLSIIGTVNVDETTFSFAPKVLDRAFVLEFNDVNYDEVCMDWPHYREIRDELNILHDLLRPSNLHFGYRVVWEMTQYLQATQGGWPYQGDFLIISKILPKLRGGEDKLGAILPVLLAYCTTGLKDLQVLHEVATEFVLDLQEGLPMESTLRDLGLDLPVYPRSAEKTYRMLRELLLTGLTSFF